MSDDLHVMRAKVKLESVYVSESSEKMKFVAVTKSGSYPADGSDEDNTYAKFSPSAIFEIDVRNPDLFGKMRPGKKYYVDFIEAV